jgi:hypothetical protein
VCGVRGDGLRGPADRLDGVDVAEVAEGDHLAVRRDIGRAREADRLLGAGLPR